jgi:radical SAM superfamily enzyme YgiQ (UPF0313 family)
MNVFDQVRLPRLGLPLIGRLLADAGHDVRIYVETLAPVDWANVMQSDLVGFSSTTATTPAAYAMAERVRSMGIPTVIGGSHVTFLADEALAHCDFVVRGEGHRTMLELVDALEGRADLGDIAGLSYRDLVRQPMHNRSRPPCTQDEFAALPAPALDLIVGHERMSNVPIMTQWGCPFACDFCSVIHMFGRGVRARPIEAVLDELGTYRGRGAIFFYDDNFVVNKARTQALLRGMIERGLTAPWSAQMRAEVVYRDKHSRELDHDLLGLMRDSGCQTVYCGFESINPETLKAYNKSQDVQDIRDSIRAFHDHGIHVHGMFALGADTDTAETFRQTVDFTLRNEIDTVQYLIITPCPGTPFYERMKAEGRLLTDDWSRYDGHHCVTQPAQMTPYELQMYTYQAMARFYSARHALGLMLGNMARNLPFLLTLLWRERRLHLQLPRVALMSLLPSRQPEVLNVLQQALSRESWERLTEMMVIPLTRLYGRFHVRQWLRQTRSRDYLGFLRRWGRPPRRRRQTAGTS